MTARLTPEPVPAPVLVRIPDRVAEDVVDLDLSVRNRGERRPDPWRLVYYERGRLASSRLRLTLAEAREALGEAEYRSERFGPNSEREFVGLRSSWRAFAGRLRDALNELDTNVV